MLSNHLILCHPLLLLPSIFPSIRVFSSESALCIRWPEYWSFSFSVCPSNEYSGLSSFRIDQFGFQGTLKSLLQHHSVLESAKLVCAPGSLHLFPAPGTLFSQFLAQLLPSHHSNVVSSGPPSFNILRAALPFATFFAAPFSV